MDKTYFEILLEEQPYFKEALYDLVDKAGKENLEVEYAETFAENVYKLYPSIGKLFYIDPAKDTSTARELQGTTLNIFYQVYHFLKFGKKVFRLTDNLVENLMATEMGKVPADLIRMPFGTIYFSIGEQHIQILDPRTGYHRVTGIFVTTKDINQNLTLLRFLACGKANKASKHTLDDSVYFFQIMLDRTKPLEEAVSVTGDPIEYSDEVVKSYYTQIKTICHFIFNVLLYITSKEFRTDFAYRHAPSIDTSKLKSKSKIRKRNKKANKISKLPYYSIGDEITISVYNKEGLRGDMPIDKKFHYSYRFVVHGHWRHYTDRNNGKPKWIKPYYKGPTIGDIVDKNYKVDL